MTHSAASLWDSLAAYTRPLQEMSISNFSRLREVSRSAFLGRVTGAGAGAEGSIRQVASDAAPLRC